MKSAINYKDPRHLRARNLLRDRAGYRLIAQSNCDWTSEPATIQIWAGRKGTVICQYWEGGGVTMFADWPLGNTWEETEKALL